MHLFQYVIVFIVTALEDFHKGKYLIVDVMFFVTLFNVYRKTLGFQCFVTVMVLCKVSTFRFLCKIICW